MQTIFQKCSSRASHDFKSCDCGHEDNKELLCKIQVSVKTSSEIWAQTQLSHNVQSGRSDVHNHTLVNWRSKFHSLRHDTIMSTLKFGHFGGKWHKICWYSLLFCELVTSWSFEFVYVYDWVWFWNCLCQVKRRLLPTIQPLQTGRGPEPWEPKVRLGS